MIVSSAPITLQRVVARGLVTVFFSLAAFGQAPAAAHMKVGTSGKLAKAAPSSSVLLDTTETHLPLSAISAFVLTHPVQTYSMQLRPDPEAAPPGYPVSFTIKHSFPSGNPSIRFALDYGDGIQDYPTFDAPRATHVFTQTGVFKVVATVVYYSEGAAKRRIPQYGDSVLVAIDSVALSVVPAHPVVDQEVGFTVGAIPGATGLVYRFSFGDGGPFSPWDPSPVARHSYKRADRFFVVAEIGRPGHGTVIPVTRTRVQEIVVLPVASQYTEELLLRADPPHGGPGTPIRFTVELQPPVPDAQYRFEFGDGKQSEWQGASSIVHRYPGAREYRASAEAKLAGRILRSDPFIIRIDSPIVPSPDGTGGVPALVWVVGAIAAVAAASLTIRRVRRSIFLPRPSFTVKTDSDAPRVTSAQPPRIAVRITVKPNFRQGQFSAATNNSKLITSIRRRRA